MYLSGLLKQPWIWSSSHSKRYGLSSSRDIRFCTMYLAISSHAAQPCQLQGIKACDEVVSFCSLNRSGYCLQQLTNSRYNEVFHSCGSRVFYPSSFCFVQRGRIFQESLRPDRLLLLGRT